MPPLNEFQKAFVGHDLATKDQIIDPETGGPVDWAALASDEASVTNIFESTTYLTQIVDQPGGVPGLDGSGKIKKPQLPDDTLLGAFQLRLEGGGAPITAGTQFDFEVPFACTLTGWTLLADQTGDIVIDIWKDTYANFPPTVADTICTTSKPTLSGAVKAQDTDISGNWTSGRVLARGQIIRFNVDSADAVEAVTLSLQYSRA